MLRAARAGYEWVVAYPSRWRIRRTQRSRLALDELGDLYELDGAIVHRVVAYRNAAKAVRDASVSVTALAREGRATELPGVGAVIQEKVLALADTGEIPAAVKLRAKFPPGLVQVTRLPGLGPKRARRLYDELGVDSLQALQEAATTHRIRDLKGFGAKAEESILASLAQEGAGEKRPRTVLNRALAVGEELIDALRAHPASDQVELAGSARRWTDSVKDLDVIATASDPLALAQAAAALPLVENAGKPGAAGVRAQHPLGAERRYPDRRARPVRQPAPALHRVQGAQHGAPGGGRAPGPARVRVRDPRRCRRRDTPLRDRNRGLRLLGMQYIEPELRENRGELEAATRNELPDLVTDADLKGDLHCHTTASDGTASIEEMAAAAAQAGYEYLAITDHSASMGFGADLSGTN